MKIIIIINSHHQDGRFYFNLFYFPLSLRVYSFVVVEFQSVCLEESSFSFMILFYFISFSSGKTIEDHFSIEEDLISRMVNVDLSFRARL